MVSGCLRLDLWHYDSSHVGVPCVEVQRYMAYPNITLKFSIPCRWRKIRKYLKRCDQHSPVFEEVSYAADIHTGRPALEVGDFVIVDNLLAHRGEAEDALTDFLNELSIDLLYLSVYSPDFNSVEECFSKMKYLLKYPLRDMVYQKLELAILHTVEAIEPADSVG